MSIEKFDPEYWKDLIRHEMGKYDIIKHIIWMPESVSFGDEVCTTLGPVSVNHGAYFNFMVNSIEDLQDDVEKAREAVKNTSERLAYDTEQYLLSELKLESLSEVPKNCVVFFFINKILAYPTQFVYGIKGLTLCGILINGGRCL